MCRKLKGVSIIGLWMIFIAAFSLFTVPHASAQVDPVITVTQATGGTITPGTVTVPLSTNQIFTITPDPYYHIVDVTVDGGSVKAKLTWSTTNKKIAYYKFVAVNVDHVITATYAIDTKKLTIQKFGAGATNGTVTAPPGLDAGINCGVGCTSDSEDYPVDTGSGLWPSVELKAEDASGSIFKGWYRKDGTQIQKTSPLTITMNKNWFIKAKFNQTYTLSTSTDGGDGTGTVTATLVSGKKISDGVYLAGSVLAVTANPSSGSNFTVWSGSVPEPPPTTRRIKVTMNGNKTLKATFALFSGAGAAKITSKVSVVDAKSPVTLPKPGVQSLRIGPLAGFEPPPGSDYELDQTNVYVEERSAESFKTINEILCKIDQAKYDEMLNKGPYKAQIDKNLCSSGKDSASDAGQQSQNQSSGANMPDYELWTLKSYRENDSSPHYVEAWIHQKGGQYEPDSLIFAKVKITEGVSAENPYGLFTVSFKGHPIHPETGQMIPDFKLFYGFLKTELDPDTGKVLLKFADKFNIPEDVAAGFGIEPYTFIEKATLDKRPDGTGKGTAYTFEKGTYEGGPDGDSETFNFAFDNDYFRRADVGIPDPLDLCLDRNTFGETVWSYGLYDSTTGMRINRNSGFSIKKTVTTIEGDKDYYGWIGYWGAWFPEEVTLNHEDEVYKVTYGPDGGEEVLYNVFKSGGKLKKHVKNTLTLGEITNIPLDYSEQTEAGYTSYRVKWYDPDGEGAFPKAFYKVESLNMFTNTWEALPAPVPIDLLNLNNSILNFWSQALNGNVQVKPACAWIDAACEGGEWNEFGECVGGVLVPAHFECAAVDLTGVVFYSDELVYPGDEVPASFACFNNCPDADKLAAVPDPPATPFGDPLCDLTCQAAWADYMSWNPFNDYSSPQFDTVPAAAPHATYTLDAATHVLQSDGADVLANKMHPNFQWGYMSGPLFDSTIIDFMACDLDGNLNPDTCGWLAWTELYEYYTWETGSNDWNQFIALEDPLVPGSVLTFDPPLLVSYVHEWDPINNPGVTSTFYLDYSGFGNLQGIPGKCVDRDTGEEIPCGPDSRWLPQFNIPEGSLVTDASDNVTQYYVKPLEMEQQMLETDMSNCPVLGKPYALPDLATWVDPAIGPEPEVPGAPAVIGGVIGGGGTPD